MKQDYGKVKEREKEREREREEGLRNIFGSKKEKKIFAPCDVIIVKTRKDFLLRSYRRGTWKSFFFQGANI